MSEDLFPQSDEEPKYAAKSKKRVSHYTKDVGENNYRPDKTKDVHP